MTTLVELDAIIKNTLGELQGLLAEANSKQKDDVASDIAYKIDEITFTYRTFLRPDLISYYEDKNFDMYVKENLNKSLKNFRDSLGQPLALNSGTTDQPEV